MRGLKLFFLFFFANASIAQSDYYEVERIARDKDLSQVFVSCIAEDKDGFIWVGTKFGINRFDGFQFKSYFFRPDDEHSIPNNSIQAIYKDRADRLWVGTYDGIALYDPIHDDFIRLNNNKLKFPVRSFFEDSKGRLWVVNSVRGVIGITNFKSQEEFDLVEPTIDAKELAVLSRNTKVHQDTQGIFYFISKKQTLVARLSNGAFTFLDNRNYTEGPYSKNSQFAVVDKNNNLWLKQSSGWIKNMTTSDSLLLPKTYTPEYAFRFNLDLHPDYGFQELDEDGNWWLGGYTGHLIVFNPSTRKHVRVFSDEFVDPEDITEDYTNLPYMVTTLFKDRNGNIWVGTNGDGLFIYKSEKPNFNSQGFYSKLDGISMRSMFLDNNDNLWFANAGGKLFNYNAKTKRVRKITGSLDNYQGDEFGSFFKIFEYLYRADDDTYWAIRNRKIAELTLKQDQIATIQVHPIDDLLMEQGIQEVRINYIVKDGDEIWTRTKNYIISFNIVSKKVKYWKLNQPPSKRTDKGLECFIQSGRTLWISRLDGILAFDKRTFKQKFYSFDDGTNRQDYSINSITIDPNNQNVFWLTSGTYGLIKYNIKTKEKVIFDENNGIPNSFAYSAQFDKHGYLWLSTNNGLCRFNPQIGNSDVYDASFGLQAAEFNSNSSYVSPSGELFFGGINGLNRFVPPARMNEYNAAPVLFTNMSYDNIELDSRDKNSPVANLFNTENSILVPADVNIIGFEFVSLNFTFPKATQYQYKLDGFDQKWYNLNDKKTLTFTNLSAGSYVLNVRARIGEKGKYNEPTKLHFEVLAPWFRTKLAYVIYVVLFLSIFFIVFYALLRRKQALNEAAQVKELNEMKNRFFSNVSHEFRTPLTLINGLPENLKIAFHNQNEEQFYRDIDTIERNGAQLLQQVNQLLELSKIESVSTNLSLEPIDVKVYLEIFIHPYRVAAEQKGLRFEFISSLRTPVINGDHQALHHILQNILGNALKFTESGSVSVSIEQNEQKEIVIKVADDGIGIAPKELDKVFDRFYQVDDQSTRAYEGTGIGLALAKELTELMNGRIEVQSSLNRGSVFSIIFPTVVGQEFVQEKQLNAEEHEEKTLKELILLIEDNADMQSFIKSILIADYNVEIASNGLEGLEMAKKLIPDFIISDWMMPKMSGPEVIQKLKSDPLTSHIPSILLTAKSSTESKIEGLKTGAVAYLTKPFNSQELTAQVESLFAARLALQEHLNSSPESTKTPKKSPEFEFLSKTKSIITEQIESPSFNGDQLAKAMNYSRSQFARKIKALTGNSLTQMIREVRMTKAKDLILNTDLTISEVAYQTGFEDPSYFTRVFTKFWKSPPSDLRK